MPELSAEELIELLVALELATDEAWDELLTDLLIRPYPTRVMQDN